MCPVNLYQLYVSKLNPSLNKLWQKPRSCEVFYSDAVWYEARPVGHDPLEHFMKYLIKWANLDGKDYTNHSIRATCIGTLDTRGFEAHHISAISSHKNESTICTYSTKCPEGKKREMFDALASTIVPQKKKNKPQETISKAPASTVNTAQLQEITNIPQTDMTK